MQIKLVVVVVVDELLIPDEGYWVMFLVDPRGDFVSPPCTHK